MLRNSNVRVLEIAPPWVDTDLVHKSGDARSMPLGAFVSQVLEKLATDADEILVDAALEFRANPGKQEHTLVNQFNQFIQDNPIPVA